MSVHEGQPVVESGQSLDEADKAVIMLHGRGAKAENFIELSKQLPGAAYLAPQAANRQWYPRSFLEPREKNQPHLDSAMELVESLIDRASGYVGKENVYLIGFSQGACLASEYVASNASRHGGLFALSGGLIGEEVQEFSGDLEETPVYIGCSENDPHIPLERVNRTAEIFEKLNGVVEKQIFPGSNHGVFQPEIDKISEILE